MAREKQDKPHYHKQQQHISSRKECRIHSGKASQQYQTPQETIPEILALLFPVIALNIKCKTEQQSKDGVCFSGKKREYNIEYSLV